MDLYERVLAVAQPYHGKNTERFIERQCRRHLNIEPSMLSAQHLDQLARWCYISSALVMDEDRAQEFRQKITALKTGWR